MRTLQRDIDAAKANRDRLAAKLAECDAAIIERRAQAMTLARDGAADADLDRAEAATRAALDRKETISGAIAEVVQQLSKLEAEHAENADRILREQTAKEVEQFTRRSVDDGDAFVKAAARWADSLAKLAPIVPESQALLHLLQVCTTEALPNSDKVAQLARVHRDAVRDGRAAATLPVPPPAYTAPAVPPKPPTQVVFCLRSVRWRDDSGAQRFGRQFNDVELPMRLVGHALKSGACVPIIDPRRKELHTQGGPQTPGLNSASALDLDAEPERRAEPIMQSTPPQFTVVDRGPPKIVQIATTRS